MLRSVYVCMGCLLWGLECSLSASAQNIEKIVYKAKLLVSKTSGGEPYRLLKEEAVFTHGGLRMTCDSARYFYQRMYIEAFGHVVVRDSTGTITAERLLYDGKERRIYLREDVFYLSEGVTLETDSLDYYVRGKTAHYKQGGRLITGESVLTSRRGVYNRLSKESFFYDSVFLQHPRYLVRTDSLHYHTVSKWADIGGPSEVKRPGQGTIYAYSGTINTDKALSMWHKAEVRTATYVLRGDELYADEIKGYYEACGGVRLDIPADSLSLFGHEGFYDTNRGVALLYDMPLARRILTDDTLYLQADTLKMLKKMDASVEQLHAFHQVRIHSRTMDARCDSLSYVLAEERIVFHNAPVVWHLDTQISSDSLTLHLRENALERMLYKGRAFVISKDLLGNFNQVKGRNMEAVFQADTLRRIHVDGNGESVYYTLENDTLLLGLNRVECGEMRLLFEQNALKTIFFFILPQGTFYPRAFIEKDQERLPDFEWREALRPRREHIMSRLRTFQHAYRSAAVFFL